MRFLIVDTETTGIEAHEKSVLDVAFGVYDTDQKAILYDVTYYVKHDGPIESSPKALEIHGLTTQFLSENGDEVPYITSQVDKFLDIYFQDRIPVLGHNVQFDIRHITATFPTIARRFSYRLMDTATLIGFYMLQLHEEGSGSLHDFAQRHNLIRGTYEKHTALDDIYITSRVMAFLQDRLVTEVAA